MRLRLSQHLRHLAASIVLLCTTGVLIGTTAGPLGASVACGCGEGAPNFAISAEPTSVTKAKPQSTVTITNINPFESASVKEILVSEKEGKSQFSFSDAPCVKTYAIGENCKFKVTYAGEAKAKITFVALDEHEAGSGTATITGTP